MHCLCDEVASKSNIMQVLNQDYSSLIYDVVREGLNLMTLLVTTVIKDREKGGG
jgi:hypothetical protein